MTLTKRQNETDEEFKLRVYMQKQSDPDMTWHDVAIIVNEALNQGSSPNKYRKEFNKKFRMYKSNGVSFDSEEQNEIISDKELLLQNVSKQLVELRKERTILADLRRDANAQLRAVDRLDNLREIARESALTIAKNFDYYKFDSSEYVTKKETDSYAEDVLLLNDWHFGIENFNNRVVIVFHKDFC